MLLTLTTTGTPDAPASDLGFLLHKHPDRSQTFGVSAGTAHVFYPAAGANECTAALLLEASSSGHVDDGAYAAGSQLAVALSSVFRTAMTGRCAARPDLAASPLPLTARIPTLTCGGGADLVRRLFAPLGWDVDARAVALDPQFPEWGDSRYLDTTLRGELRVADALTHLYVLLPVCAGAKHYRVGADEVDKLLRVAAGWLPEHPERELITRRYLAHRGAYVRSALERLAEVDDVLVEELDDALAPARVTGDAPPAIGDPVPDGPGDGPDPHRCGDHPAGSGSEGADTDEVDRPPSLARQRHAAVLAALHAEGARRVVDLGCGGGALLRVLLDDPSFVEILGVDVSAGALQTAARRLRLDRMPDRRRERIALRQSALTYTDASLTGWDAAVLMEVVEHVDPERLPALEHAVFGAARPGSVLVTTPNVEHNVRFETLETGRFRHPDHRFEWTRAQFREWADGVAAAHGYTVRYAGVGPDDDEVGPPTQMAVFREES